MRLFVAIGVNEQVKDNLCKVIEDMKQYAVQGSFSRRENLHLTLAFLGETQRLSEAEQAIHQINQKPFTLQLSELGTFLGRDGDLYWAGFQKSAPLTALQKELTKQLAAVGFSLEKRTYSPHLTLGRRIRFEQSTDMQRFQKLLKPLTMDVDKISLMRSQRIENRLIYTELDAQNLGKEPL